MAKIKTKTSALSSLNKARYRLLLFYSAKMKRNQNILFIASVDEPWHFSPGSPGFHVYINANARVQCQ